MNPIETVFMPITTSLITLLDKNGKKLNVVEKHLIYVNLSHLRKVLIKNNTFKNLPPSESKIIFSMRLILLLHFLTYVIKKPGGGAHSSSDTPYNDFKTIAKLAIVFTPTTVDYLFHNIQNQTKIKNPEIFRKSVRSMFYVLNFLRNDIEEEMIEQGLGFCQGCLFYDPIETEKLLLIMERYMGNSTTVSFQKHIPAIFRILSTIIDKQIVKQNPNIRYLLRQIYFHMLKINEEKNLYKLLITQRIKLLAY